MFYKNVSLMFMLFVLFISSIKANEKIIGSWEGKIEFRGMKLGLIIHIEKDGNKLTGKLDSPDQGAFGMEASKVEFNNGELVFHDEERGMKYVGKLNEAKNQIEGTFFQLGNELPLILNKIKNKNSEETVNNRPQTPKGPFPYNIEELEIYNEKAKIKISGTLTFPKIKEKMPAVIIIGRGGPIDRDGDLFGHKPYWVLADYLTKKGIIVFRYDRRGVGKSEGNFATASKEDYASDVNAIIAFLKTKSEVDETKIGLIGHSLGGLIAPIVASNNYDVGFLVLLGAQASPDFKGRFEERNSLFKKINNSKSLKLIEESRYDLKIFDIAKNFTNGDNNAINKMKELVIEKMRKTSDREMDFKAYAENFVNQITSEGFKEMLFYNPMIPLRKTKCPILALTGGLDIQSPPNLNFKAMKKALTKANNNKYMMEILPNVNHFLQTSTEIDALDMKSVGNNTETISPLVLETIIKWINEKI